MSMNKEMSLIEELRQVQREKKEMSTNTDYRCCICGRKANHINSYHCAIGDSVCHYCHRHYLIGKIAQWRYYNG